MVNLPAALALRQRGNRPEGSFPDFILEHDRSENRYPLFGITL